ncbi:MAG TPA: squalene synthase HpnC [Acidimicrobiales bacterium]|nr:squalene synthase HpnC [Acidimicrobiales bacterium]
MVIGATRKAVVVQIGSGNPLKGRFASPGDVVARAGEENFPVASRMLPRRIRAHLLAIYGFARLADDIGDEAVGDRLALLDWLEGELELAATGEATHPVLQRLSPVLRESEVGLEPFRCLIEANRIDQRVHRYASFDELVGYCMLSAAPVGRLVLEVFGVSTPATLALSDRVCTGLQIVEHLQDVGEDAAQGRVYLPQEDLDRFGCRVDEFRSASAGTALRCLIAMEADRARALLAAGAPLARQLPLRPRLAVAGFTAGGMAAIDSIRRAHYDVLAVRCRPRRSRLAVRALASLVGASWNRAVA